MRSRQITASQVWGRRVRVAPVLSLWLAAAAPAAVLRVDGYGGDDSHAGSSWDTDALLTIQGALAQAADGDEIWVRATTYTPPTSGSYYYIPVNKSVGIYGGFTGVETERAQRHPSHITTIECPWSGNGHGFYVTAAGGAVVIDGFTVRGGFAMASGDHAAGAGVRVNSPATVVIANCVFEYGYAYWGGGVSVGASCPSALVMNCTFHHNSAANYGGGLEASNTGTVAVNCLAYANDAWAGGGVAFWGGGSIINCTLTLNHASEAGAGGGFHAYWSGVTQISNSIFWGNTAVGAPSEIGRYSLATVNVSYSDVCGGYAGTGNIDLDPCFKRPLEDPDFRIQPCSPCTDAGDNTVLPPDAADLDRDGDALETLPVDLFGRARVADSDGAGTATVDMGAVEYGPGTESLWTLTVIVDPTPSGTVTGPGMVCTATCVQEYLVGSSITLTASDDLSGIFLGWDGGEVESQTYTFPLTADRTVTASFVIPEDGPALSVLPAHFDFGEVEPGSGWVRPFVLRNVGNEPLVLGAILPPVDPFVMETDGCSGVTLATGETCTLDVRFSPGEDDFGTLASNFEIPSNDPDENPFVVTLEGTVFRDEDGDGVSNTREQGPGGDDQEYDGDGDGEPDWLQDCVASLPQVDGAGYVTFTVPHDIAEFDGVHGIPAEQWTEEEPPPADVSFLQGVYSLNVELEPGVLSVDVTVYLPSATYPSRYYQYTEWDKTPTWYEFNFADGTGAEISANVITLHYIDGQRGDFDLDEPDGMIAAVGGPGWRAGDDDDGDGVLSTVDNCPFTFNPNQADTDGDGVGNACDGCPTNPHKTQPGVCGCAFLDTDADGDLVRDCQEECDHDRFKTEPGVCGCGTPDVDTDDDGAFDCADECPDDPGKVEAGVCGCGVPDDDSDGDGSADCIDNCIDTANPDQADSDQDGIGDACSDTDADGVSAATEDAAPGGGDGNGDGVADSLQPNVCSLPNTFGEYVTIAAPPDMELAAVAALENPSPEDTPAGAEFPAGFLSFRVLGLAPGGAADVQIIVHALSGEELNSYWKHGPTPDEPAAHWYEFLFDGATGAEFAGNLIILHLVDGARGDADLAADGGILDPGAPALVVDSGQDVRPVDCGAGACGAGVLGYLPATLCGLLGLKLGRRLRRS